MPTHPPPGARGPGDPAPSGDRPLVRVPVAPGAAGVDALLPALAAALDGTGPAIAPVPVVSSSVSNDYLMSVLSAVRADDPRSPLESDDIAVVMATSGSTGAPRGVLLSAEQLTSMTSAANAPEGARPLWIAALPVTSMGGMNVLVRALASGNVPVAMPTLGGGEPFTPTRFAQAVHVATARSSDVRVALVPAQVARLLSEDEGVDALRSCSTVLVGGGPMRDSLHRMAGELGIRVVTTYGATETSGGCVFDGVPLPGVSVTVRAALAGDPGILAIEGPCVGWGYRGEPALTAQRFSGRTFTTTDLGLVADGRVTVVGRADDVVIIKGVNVSPAAVERVLADLPDLVAATAVTIVGPDGEPQVWAFVEVRDSAPDVEAAATHTVVERLGVAARPHAVRRVARLPHLPNGKVDRHMLEGWARDDRMRPGQED